MRGGHVDIKINDQVGQHFQTKKGLRQGDPLSPILFNIVADMLAILINRAKVQGQIKGVIPHLIDDGLSILQYADDTILFMDHDLEKAINLKLLMCAFEQLSGLKINFHKVRSSALERHNNVKLNTHSCLVANQGIILLNTLVSQCTIGN